MLKSLKVRWIIAVIGALCVVLGVIATIVSPTFGNLFACEENIRQSIPNQNGDTVAIIFEMECGATVPFNMQMSIMPASQKVSTAQNDPVLSIEGRHELFVRWIGEKTIEVVLPVGVKIFKRQEYGEGTNIVYK